MERNDLDRLKHLSRCILNISLKLEGICNALDAIAGDVDEITKRIDECENKKGH